jgi:hypothetical protein
MPIGFPAAPSVGDVHTKEGRTWRYTDDGWVMFSAFVPTTFAFTGDGATTAFDLTDDIPSLLEIGDAANVLWFEDGVWQRPDTDYTVSGTTVTRTTAPANGVAIAGVLLQELSSYSAAPFDVEDLTNIDADARAFLLDGDVQNLTSIDADARAFLADGLIQDVAMLNSLAPERLTADRTLYVSTSGSDSNDGLTVGTPFLTLQKGIDTAATYFQGGYTVTIQHAASQSPTAGMLVSKPLTGNLVIDLGACTLNVTSGTCLAMSVPGKVTVQNGKFQTTTSGDGIQVTVPGAQVIIGSSFTFNACVGAHISIASGAYVSASAGYTIAGGAGWHIISQFGAWASGAITITLTGTPAFGNSFIQMFGGFASFFNTVFSGAATGKRYTVGNNGAINTFGGGANYFPGNVAGTTTADNEYA